MNLSIENAINTKLNTIFDELGLDKKYAVVKISDRSDLSDLQCNGALALAKSERKNPREIASQIAQKLKQDLDFAKISVDGPGFINITLTNEFIAKIIDRIGEDSRLGYAQAENPQNIVIDSGGPNVAKSMHVGHLRSAVIGESIRRIAKFSGHNVISDVHFGDWGTPMGMIIAEIMELHPDWSYFDDSKKDGFPTEASFSVEEITELYKKASARCKEDEKAKENARIITAKFQDGHAGYQALWKHLREISVNAVKAIYKELDVNFDLWLGESDAHQTCYKIMDIARQKKIVETDDGAEIIRLEETAKPKPPVILEKSDGGFTYAITDIATIKMRVDDLNAQKIIYTTDLRQSLHFEQVFEASNLLGICPNTKLVHIGFGTVNGKDGKPFKTRDGGVMNLEDLIKLSKDEVRKTMPKAEEVNGYTQEQIDKMTDEIAIAAIKFQDLKNSIASGYIFSLEDFARFDGKTGPYIQYAIARINSIIRKAQETGINSGNIIISNTEERLLALKIAQFANVVARAAEEVEPSIISDFAYSLAQTFSSFYNTSSIMNAENTQLAASRLQLARISRDMLKQLLFLLGISAPEVMLKSVNSDSG
ncbi:MAG: arginine--tRNA ligase, partial [Alphaproteobacteria bacterium]|nr:arginine--tRNA ligase [Alphaproteobacteria bacterium]